MNETTTTPELAPCPMCERKPFFDRVTAFSGTKTVGFKVECVVSCGLRIFTETDTPDEAAAAWNFLAASVALGKLAPKLAEALKEIVIELRQVPAMQSRKYDYLGIKTLDALREFDALTATTKEAQS